MGFFNKNIKSVKAEWRTNPKYPEGSSLGYKEFTVGLKKFNNNEELAVKSTTFYKTMSEKEFSKIAEIDNGLKYGTDRISVLITK